MADLYLKNGRDVLGTPLEVAITGTKITAVAPHLDGIQAGKTIDLHEAYLTAGWIDDHTHCYEKLSLYYDDPDLDGYPSGVCTVIDAGSTGADNIGDFYRVTRRKKTNVLAMINVSRTGILAQDELGDMSRIQPSLVVKAISDYPDFIVGLKVRESRSVVIENDVKPLIAAKQIQQQIGGLPLMVHIGTNPPELRDVLALMTEGDVLTHAYNGKPNGILDQRGNVENFVWEAYHRGVIFDVGHGTDSFNFATAHTAFKAGLKPCSLSTDIYHRNRENGPVYNMATCMEKLLHLGYALADIIPMVTTAPAENFNLRTKGRLAPGMDADVTVFAMTAGEKVLTDSNGNRQTSKQLITPTYTVIGGQVYDLKGAQA